MNITKFKGDCCSNEELHSHCERCDHVYKYDEYNEEFKVDSHFHCYKEKCLDTKLHTHCVKKDCNILDYYEFKRFSGNGDNVGPFNEIFFNRHIHCNKCIKTSPHFHCDYEKCVGKIFTIYHKHCIKCFTTAYLHYYCKKCDVCYEFSSHNYCEKCDVCYKDESHDYCVYCNKCSTKHNHCIICNKITEFHYYKKCRSCYKKN